MPRKPLPDVVIGGAPRSGTTFLCEVLAKHPAVYVARPFIPEPKVLMTPHPDGDPGLLQRYVPFFSDAPEASTRVEKTSYYFENEDARSRFARVLPEAKIIFILREPVARAYSNWQWSTRNGLETLSFAEAIAAEGARASPLKADRAYARPYDYIERGLYSKFAANWIEAIGRKRIAFYMFEQAIAEPEAFVEDLQDFIGVERIAWPRLQTGVVNANDLADGEIEPAVASSLRARFATEMAQLACMTGLDISRWGYRT